MSITTHIRRYLHAILFVALATVIIASLGYLISLVPETTLTIGERNETYTTTTPKSETLLFSRTCESSGSCVFYDFSIPSTCDCAKFDYSQCTALSSYWITVHDGFSETYTVPPGSIFFLNRTGVLVNFNLGPWETLKVYCVDLETVTYTTTIPAVQVSNRELLSLLYFVFTIVIVITGIRKFLPQF